MPDWLIHVLTVVITALAVENRRWIVNFFVQTFRRTPQVNGFKKDIQLAGYKKDPKKRFHCYLRKNHKPRKEDLPTYHFFIKEELEIQVFMAFLLPSLDLGHGLRPSRDKRDEKYLDDRFGKNWDKYLRDIAKKVREASDLQLSVNARSLRALKHDALLPLGSRIVFFDKSILLLFIFESDWIFGARDGTGSRQDRFAQAVIEYAEDIVVIHDRMQLYERAITCRYVSESVVEASEYYDFGLYMVEGTQVVYAPIYRNDNDHRIQTEKIFVGDTVRQKRRISEFVADYKTLWQEADEKHDSANGKKVALTEGGLSDPSSQLHALDYLSSDYFEHIYVKKLQNTLAERCGFSIPPIDPAD